MKVRGWSRALPLLLLLALLLPLFLPALIPEVHAQSEPVPSITTDQTLILRNQGETFTVTFKASNKGGSPNDRGWSHVTISVSDGLEIVGWTRWSDRDRKYSIGEPIWYRNERQIPAQNEMLEAYGSFPAGATRELTVTFRVKSPGWQWIKYRFTIVHFTQDEDWRTALYYRDPSSGAYTDQQGWPIYRAIVGQDWSLVDVETGMGGRGWMNDNGGRFLVGMEIRIFCSVGVDVSSLKISISKVGSQGGVTLLERGPSPAGRYQASYSTGEEGRYGIACNARIDNRWSWPDVTFIEVVRDTTPPTVRVIAPNGGERLTPGSVFRIRWEASDNLDEYSPVMKATIQLYQGGTYVMDIASNIWNVVGYYDWTVPNRPGTGYKIRVLVRDLAGNVGYDESDGTFEIAQEQRTVTVTVYATTIRTVTSALHATATTETTTYTTTTRTLYTTFTRTWYTTVTTTVTTTITSWTTTTSWVPVFSGRSVSYERSGEGLVVLSLAALTPLASAYILRTRRRSRNSGGVMRG
jgi:hypothetical protein